MTTRVASRRLRGAAAATLLSGAVACAPARPPERPVSPVTAIDAQPARLTWQLKVREHVDLWLHGWAMVLQDSAQVPLFRRGWRDETTVYKNQRGILTSLDTSLTWLREGVRRNPNLAQGQFVAQLAPTLLELQRGLEAFEASGGNPRRAGDQAALVASLAQSFTTPADRVWLKRFAQGLQDEYDRWFHQWWVEQQRLRAGVIAAATATWQGALRDRVAPFLRETRQLNGEGLLVLPLAGEGRTVMLGPQQPSAAVGLPPGVDQANEVVFALIHEQAGVLALQVVADNTTPAEKRAGLADLLTSAAAVRAGALLLDRVAPALAEGYRQFYLAEARATGRPFEQVFALPPVVATGLVRQLDLMLGGL